MKKTISIIVTLVLISCFAINFSTAGMTASPDVTEGEALRMEGKKSVSLAANGMTEGEVLRMEGKRSMNYPPELTEQTDSEKLRQDGKVGETNMTASEKLRKQ